MGLLYDFGRLIEKYSVVCTLLKEPQSGRYEGGNWIPDAAPEPEVIMGAVVPMTDRKIYQSGGAYTEGDREFITPREIALEPAAYIICQGMKYHVESENDYSVYAGFHDYNLKRVGAFDRADKH